jgi:hypothetical protein
MLSPLFEAALMELALISPFVYAFIKRSLLYDYSVVDPCRGQEDRDEWAQP